MNSRYVRALTLLSLIPTSVFALEYPVGQPIIKNGMDIHAVEDNPNGFAEGDWIPYLTVEYTVTKLDAPEKKQQGTFMAMVASDGPHYGENLKLDGNGQYNVTYKIYPPSYNKDVVFGRHIDKETGVAAWFEPFEVSWDFNYSGTGRKGSY